MTRAALFEVLAERRRQDAKFPDQHLPDGTSEIFARFADMAKATTDAAAAAGVLTWRDVLREEFCEALAEEDRAKLRVELIQVAAVAVRWVEDIDRQEELEAE